MGDSSQRHSTFHNRLYSPGGCSVFVILAPLMAASVGVFFALIGLAGLALVALIAAIVVTVIFARRSEQRKAEGKTLGWKIAIPIVLYALSVPYLIFFIWLFFFQS